ncbi:CG13102 [Drosophila busckii]|uniref:CG13102 n=1 Tax=Drosophila busckii TaxID=30019 RepID=A0A0M4E155_DROBS|nr:uncharacterized protein LOC108603596 [Drosophila busckii]ALC39028.1 CG13102 [Drosophila busckii]
MNKIAIVVSLLFAFCGLQLVNSLTCYSCTTPNDCKNARKTTCTNAAANETSHQLEVYHQRVPNITSSNRFECLALVYTFPNNKTVTHQLHGCVHPAASACTLQLKPQYSSWNKQKCALCSGDKCNKNPAGKLSSSVYTIGATVVGLMLAKVYA